MTKQKRLTKQKKVIYDVLASTTSHPTADWIYQQAREQIPDISLGTVYRNLQNLAEDRQILELNYGKSQTRFDANAQNHYHFVCEQCGSVLDFPYDAQAIPGAILNQAPGQVSSYRFECYGICADCLAQMEAPQAAEA